MVGVQTDSDFSASYGGVCRDAKNERRTINDGTKDIIGLNILESVQEVERNNKSVGSCWAPHKGRRKTTKPTFFGSISRHSFVFS